MSRAVVERNYCIMHHDKRINVENVCKRAVVERNYCIMHHDKRINVENVCEMCCMLSTSVNITSQMAVLEANTRIVASGLPNHEGCKIPVDTMMNVNYLEAVLGEYQDREIIRYIKYGWPIDHDGRETNTTPPRNHSSATSYPKDILGYLEKELMYGAVVGPFKHNPLTEKVALSPLSTREKKDSLERRVIVDMSFPEGKAVNEGIDKNSYQGESVCLTYPTIDKMVELMIRKGKGGKLFKRDLKRAFRQFKVDPGDIGLLGYVWDDHYFFDTVLAMGCRSAPYICQRIANMIRYLYQQEGEDYDCVNMLDDYGGYEELERAEDAYAALGHVMDKVGVEQSHNKNCPPCFQMIFLGVLLCAITMTMQVTGERLAELTTLLKEWLKKSSYSRKDLESLVGKLNFVCACVRSSRVFMARFLNELRQTPRHGTVKVSDEMCKDVRWWLEFLVIYNGVSVISGQPWSAPDELLSCDACLQGCGAWSQGEYFHRAFPTAIQKQGLHINALELLTLVVSVRLWRKKLQGKRFVVWCDNMATVTVVTSGRSRDSFMQSCLRELVWWLALMEAEIRVQHIATTENRIADVLSRWDIEMDAKSRFVELVGPDSVELGVADEMFEFVHDW